MATLREVAARAGVSIKTVSRIVNGEAAVNARTRDAVAEHLRELNYVPNHAARMMRGGVSNVFGLMTDAVATTHSSVDIVRGVQAELKLHGKTLLIANTDGEADQEAEFWRLFRAQKVAGVIYASVFHRAQDVGSPSYARAIVLANCFATHADRPSIIPDDEAGGYAQAQYLLKNGHRRIALLTLIPEIEATRLRGKGIRRAFRDAGVPFDEALDRRGVVGAVARETIVGYEVALELLRAKGRPSAIISGNDQIALQIFSAAAHLGLRVPQDLSIMGFDDLAVISKTLRPALTTVALPYFDIGRLAVRITRQAETEEPGWAPKVLVPCPLVERESCRALV